MDEKFISPENTFVVPVCNKCKNHIKYDNCRAYDIIPDEILLGDEDHIKARGDEKEELGKKIVFESDNSQRSN